ncbi:MAG: hypothetical protein ACREQT_12210 [Candidatus Binataceae bacterium]
MDYQWLWPIRMVRFLGWSVFISPGGQSTSGGLIGRVWAIWPILNWQCSIHPVLTAGSGGLDRSASKKTTIGLEVNGMSVREAVISQFEQVAKEQKKELAPLSDDLQLLNSGLDSLCFAIIVARLEDSLGLDPFSTDQEIDFPVTLSDFIRCYEDVPH